MPVFSPRLTLAALVALAAPGAVQAWPDRDLVIDAGEKPIRIRVVTMIDGKPVEERRQAFFDLAVQKADTNGDGILNEEELRTAYRAVGLPPGDSVKGSETPLRSVAETLRDVSTAQGTPAAEIVVQPLPLVDRLELFAGLDADDDGFVTAAEFADADHLFARYDADGDGTLSAPELAPTEPLQPMPIRSGANFPPGRFPFRWEEAAGEPDVFVEVKLIGRAFGRPKVLASGGRQPPGPESRDPLDQGADAPRSPLSITSEPRKVSFDLSGLALDLDATPARITSEDVLRFYLLQLRQRDADKNGYLTEDEFNGLGLPGLDYQVADANGDGMLFPKELSERLAAIVARESSRVRIEATFERQPLFTKLDTDGDERLSRRELRNSREALSSADVDGDGRIGLAEFGGRYRLSFSVPNLLDGANPRMVAEFNAMPRGPSPRAADGPSWFAAMDRNADGDLTRREFLGRADLFATFDADADGLLSPEEATAADDESRVQSRETRDRNQDTGGEGE